MMDDPRFWFWCFVTLLGLFIPVLGLIYKSTIERVKTLEENVVKLWDKANANAQRVGTLEAVYPNLKELLTDLKRMVGQLNEKMDKHILSSNHHTDD